MYAARPGIKPWRANRAGGNGAGRRLLAAVAAVAALSIAFSLGARGGGDTHYTTVERMYAARPGIKPWRANRAGGNGSWRRLLAAVAAVAALSIAFSLGA